MIMFEEILKKYNAVSFNDSPTTTGVAYERDDVLAICKEVHNSALNLANMAVRPFDDLIKEIEFDGEKFIPAQKIAALCFNYKDNAVKQNPKMWVNASYDYSMWYQFETNIMKPLKHECSIGISRNFDITTYFKIGAEEAKKNIGMPAYNQVEIMKNLIKWGFIAL